MFISEILELDVDESDIKDENLLYFQILQAFFSTMVPVTVDSQLRWQFNQWFKEKISKSMPIDVPSDMTEDHWKGLATKYLHHFPFHPEMELNEQLEKKIKNDLIYLYKLWVKKLSKRKKS